MDGPTASPRGPSALKSAAVLGAGNLVGKVVAFVREIVFASAFGTGLVAVGFRAAQSVSFVPANLVAGDVLSGAFVPAYARAVKAENGSARKLAFAYVAILGILLGGAALVVAFASRAIIDFVIPGAASDAKVMATSFLCALSVTIPLYGISAVCALILATHQRMLAQSLRPTLQSIGLLVGTVLAVFSGWVPWLAVGFSVAWLVYTMLVLALCIQSDYVRASGWRSMGEAARLIRADARRLLPLLPLPIALQAGIISERFFSSLGADGLIAAVDYARLVSDSIMSLVAIPLGLVGLTRLSGITREAFAGSVIRGARAIFIAMVPVAALLAVLASPIVTLLYQRGAFGVEDTYVTALVLQGQCLFLALQVLAYFLSRAALAQGKSATVLWVTVGGVIFQGITQMLVITPLGGLAIGLGPSAYGLFMSVALILNLGILKSVTTVCLMLLPCGAVGLIAILWSDRDWIGSMGLCLTVVIIWSLTVLIVPSIRGFFRDEILAASFSRSGRR